MVLQECTVMYHIVGGGRYSRCTILHGEEGMIADVVARVFTVVVVLAGSIIVGICRATVGIYVHMHAFNIDISAPTRV